MILLLVAASPYLAAVVLSVLVVAAALADRAAVTRTPARHATRNPGPGVLPW